MIQWTKPKSAIIVVYDDYTVVKWWILWKLLVDGGIFGLKLKENILNLASWAPKY